MRRILMLRRKGCMPPRIRTGSGRFIENRQKSIEKLWIGALQSDRKTAKTAFDRLLKLSFYHFPASILLAASMWDTDGSPLTAEFGKLLEKLPIDIVSRGKVGSISKFAKQGIFGVTDIGGKWNNEDAIAVFRYKGKTFLLLADGLGGHQRGEEASHIAIIAMLAAIEKDPDNLPAAVREAHRRVQDISARGRKKPGTTLSVAVINGRSIDIAHVGDSPVYLIKKSGVIQLLTYPHSHVGKMAQSIKDGDRPEDFPEAHYEALQETDLANPPYPLTLIFALAAVQQWMITGQFILRMCAHKLLRVVGSELGDVIPVKRFRFERGDWLLLSSDGLNLAEVARDGEGLDEKLVRILGQAGTLQARVDAFMGIVRSLQDNHSDNTSALFFEG